MTRVCPEWNDRSSARFTPRAALAALTAVLALGFAACGQSETSEEPNPQAEQAAAMASEHEGDRPEATEAAATEPAVEVKADPVIYGEVAGEKVEGYLAQPENLDRPRPGILVIHEWWGLNDNIRAMTRRLAGEGYVALAVDLYGGQSADTPEQARELMSSVDPDVAIDNLRQAQEHLAERLAATGDLDQRIGVIGWCFGGGWSLRTALAMPDQIDATVIYYGHLITEPERLEKLDSPILGIFGAEDQGIPVEQVRELESALEDLGKSAEIHVYEGAGHAFANPSGTRYMPEAARDAWRRTVDFLSRHLAPATESTSGREGSSNGATGDAPGAATGS